jgi:hypothetical protein
MLRSIFYLVTLNHVLITLPFKKQASDMQLLRLKIGLMLIILGTGTTTAKLLQLIHCGFTIGIGFQQKSAVVRTTSKDFVWALITSMFVQMLDVSFTRTE